jgi:ATP-dependent RNA helicase DHX37/DHR1
LNPVELTYPSNSDRYRFFARFLLEGRVCTPLAKYTPLLLNKPNILNKPWSKARVVAILQPLIDHQIDSRAKLVAKWTVDKRFLLDAFALWVDSEHHQEIVGLWPPVEAMAEGVQKEAKAAVAQVIAAVAAGGGGKARRASGGTKRGR